MRFAAFILVALLLWDCTELVSSPSSTQTPTINNANSIRSYIHGDFRIDITLIPERNSADVQVFFEEKQIEDRHIPFGSGRFSDDRSLFVYHGANAAYIWRVENGQPIGSFGIGFKPYGLYTDSEFIIHSICQSTRGHSQCSSSQVAIYDSRTGENIAMWDDFEFRDIRSITRSGEFVQISGCEAYKYDMFVDCRTQNTIERELPRAYHNDTP